MSGQRPESPFVHNLKASGLLSDSQLADAEQVAGRADDDHALARLLVEAGMVTEFQAEQILAGRTKGFVIGPYVVQDRIGAGGMGQVFKAVHRDMGRTVALKVMAGERRKDVQARARFMREARAAAKLEHPNIVTIHDVREEGGVTYIVMQYVEGEDVHQRIKREGRLAPAEAARIARRVATALEHARQQGIIHRDIKPSNILVNAGGTAKVLDMGLARIEHEGDEGRSAASLGTAR